MFDDMFERRELVALPAAELAPLTEQMPPAWPETWRDLATSHFATLISAPGSEGTDPQKLAKLAMALALGVAQDLGGTQPYIPVGAMLLASARAKQAIDMLNARHTYREAAEATGLTEARIRKIEVEWRREEISRRQGRLQLD